MRSTAKKEGISVFMVAGTYVVLMGFDATEKARQGLLGFAIHRTDNTENEQYWLQGFRTFKETYPNPAPGTLVSTQEHPVQDFVWGDFTAKPNHRYIYKVVPVYGAPKNLQYGPAVDVDVATESETGETHFVYFNRGVIGSQAYARKFKNISPDKLEGKEQKEAFTWLSRGLEEAMKAFIQQASSPRYGLRAAVYEFSYEPVFAEFGAALKKCKDVQIVYDARIPTSGAKKIAQTKQRVAAVKRLLKKYKLTDVSTPRTRDGNYIAHNKFIVLLNQGKPTAVWTGSTNFTESGIFGQSNVGHAVFDEDVAQQYFHYWERLQKDPAKNDISKENQEAGPDLLDYPPETGVTTIFSPRKTLAMLNWYAGKAMKQAGHQLCFTAAFGINKLFLDILKVRADHLRYLFLEKWGVSAKLAEVAQKDLGADRYNQVAIGGYLAKDVLTEYLKRRWEAERSNSLSKNVRYVHSKYMLVDPLGDDPLVISGSANFSDASTRQNDENMLVIRGDRRVADIYVGEFMRLWQHYRFRYIVNKNAQEGGDDSYEPNYLDSTPRWADPYYKKGSVKFKKRKAFAGPAAVTGEDAMDG